MKRLILLLLVCAAAVSSCHHIDDDRIPPVAVHVAFNTVGDWNIYGVGGAGSYRCFIKAERQPAGFPYTATTYTGFGGVLLIGDIYGTPVAYDLSCPVEAKTDIRIQVVADKLIGECPVCHSTYDLVTNYGYPLSGKAAADGYALRRYNVGPGLTGEYMVITR